MKRILLLLFVLSIVVSCSQEGSDAASYLKDGQKAFLAGKYREARDLLGKGLTLAPSNQDLIYYMGLCYQKEYVYDSALFYIRKADLLYRNNREINLAKLQIAPQVRDWDLAIDAMLTLIDLGDPPDQYWPQLAEYNAYLKHYMHVLFYMRKIVENQPEDTAAYLKLVGAAISANSLYVASAILDTAIDKFGPREEFTANRGSIYSFLGEYEKAENIFRTLLATDSANSFYKLNLASTLASYDRRDKKEEALNLFDAIKQELGGSVDIDSLIIRTTAELENMD
ncbi:MAG: hypothetical protein P1R58_01345 [bacterium]|nr:hypothetical protein [bacterium]